MVHGSTGKYLIRIARTFPHPIPQTPLFGACATRRGEKGQPRSANKWGYKSSIFQHQDQITKLHCRDCIGFVYRPQSAALTSTEAAPKKYDQRQLASSGHKYGRFSIAQPPATPCPDTTFHEPGLGDGHPLGRHRPRAPTPRVKDVRCTPFSVDCGSLEKERLE